MKSVNIKFIEELTEWPINDMLQWESKGQLRTIKDCEGGWGPNKWTSPSRHRGEIFGSSLGGQTVTLGKSSSVMGRVSMVVETGLLAQLEKDCWIKTPAPVKPAMTTKIQKSLTIRLLEDMQTNPWIVEDSINSLKTSITDFVSIREGSEKKE